jgi:hypothetical protein
MLDLTNSNPSFPNLDSMGITTNRKSSTILSPKQRERERESTISQPHRERDRDRDRECDERRIIKITSSFLFLMSVGRVIEATQNTPHRERERSYAGVKEKMRPRERTGATAMVCV